MTDCRCGSSWCINCNYNPDAIVKTVIAESRQKQIHDKILDKFKEHIYAGIGKQTFYAQYFEPQNESDKYEKYLKEQAIRNFNEAIYTKQQSLVQNVDVKDGKAFAINGIFMSYEDMHEILDMLKEFYPH